MNIPVTETVHDGLSADELQKTETVHDRLSADELQKAVEKEFEMALQARVMEETKDKNNVIEAHVYYMRNKLYDKYEAIVTSSKKVELIAKLKEVEDWLYEIGEDETKGVYVAKLEELLKCEGGEWFHYSCVGLTPETRFIGKWYCPTCRNLQC